MQIPFVHHHHHFAGGPNPTAAALHNPLGMAHHSANSSYDPYLPCNSVHFYNSFPAMIDPTAAAAHQAQHPSINRRRHPAGDQPSATTTHPPSSTTTQTSQQSATTSSSSAQQPGAGGFDLGSYLSNIFSGGAAGLAQPANIRIATTTIFDGEQPIMTSRTLNPLGQTTQQHQNAHPQQSFMNFTNPGLLLNQLFGGLDPNGTTTSRQPAQQQSTVPGIQLFK
jgi:hypothetical protein